MTSLLLSHAAPAWAGCEPCLGFALPIDGQPVPTNTHLWIGAWFNWTITDGPGSFAGEVDVALKESAVPGGEWGENWVSTEVVGVLGEGSACTLSEGIIELAPPEPLAASTRFDYGGYLPESPFTGAFTTTSGEDHVGPVFAGVGDLVLERIRCDFGDRVEERVRVTATGNGVATDESSVSSFRLYADDELIAGSSDSHIRAIVPAADVAHCFSMRAVDLAGNEDDNDVAICLGPDDVTVGPSYELSAEGYGLWIEVPEGEATDDDVSTGPGCSATPGTGSRSSAWLGLLAIAFANRRRHQPRPRPSRPATDLAPRGNHRDGR